MCSTKSVVSTDRTSWNSNATSIENEVGVEILEIPIAQLDLKVNHHLTEDIIEIMNVIELEEEEAEGTISEATLKLTLQAKAETTIGVMEEFADELDNVLLIA